MAERLTDRLRSRPTAIHGEEEYWGLAWEALEWLERELEPGMTTLETGAGSSTVVFAAAGTAHHAVTPDPAEETRIRSLCESLGISSSRVTFHIGPSHEVLSSFDVPPLDLVLVDGAHGFPYPILDWWLTAPRVKVGGRVLLDDAYMPPVTAILDGLASDPAWSVEAPISFRTAVLRRRGDGIPPFDWDGGRVGGRLTFRYLPARRRVLAAARHRAFSTRVGLGLVGLYRRQSGLRWRKRG